MFFFFCLFCFVLFCFVLFFCISDVLAGVNDIKDVWVKKDQIIIVQNKGTNKQHNIFAETILKYARESIWDKKKQEKEKQKHFQGLMKAILCRGKNIKKCRIRINLNARISYCKWNKHNNKINLDNR